jgi:hypothetical protein
MSECRRRPSRNPLDFIPLFHNSHLLLPAALPDDAELSRLYCTLCSRATRLILWEASSVDSSSEEISEKVSASGGGAAGAAGLRLKASPLSFDFDGTKCADSVTIIPSSQLTLEYKAWGSARPVDRKNAKFLLQAVSVVRP